MAELRLLTAAEIAKRDHPTKKPSCLHSVERTEAIEGIKVILREAGVAMWDLGTARTSDWFATLLPVERCGK